MVSKEEIRKIARLSKLSLSDEELDALSKDMAEIIAFADTISEAVTEVGEFDNINGLENVFREDEVVASFPREDILQNRDGGEDGYYLVEGRRSAHRE